MKEAKEKLRYSTLFWLFFIGSLAGFLMEGIWRIFTIGHWENHSAVVWGPFCIVYGFGAVAMYLVAFFSEKKRLWLQFLIYAAAGMAVEYLASYFQELFFGSRSWDYSDDFLNINGRVSAGMGGIWGLCGLAFVKLLYPLLKRIDEHLHGGVFARVSCIVLSVFIHTLSGLGDTEILAVKDLPCDIVPQLIQRTEDGRKSPAFVMRQQAGNIFKQQKRWSFNGGNSGDLKKESASCVILESSAEPCDTERLAGKTAANKVDIR